MMDLDILKKIKVRKILDSEDIPYDLLLDADPSIEVISTYLAESEIYVALLESKIIGTYVLYRVDDNIMEIKNIAVGEGLQRKGIGRLLLNHAADMARAKDIRILHIATSNASFEALSLYQKAGFDMDHIKKNYILDNYPLPLFDNGIQCRHMIVLIKYL